MPGTGAQTREAVESGVNGEQVGEDRLHEGRAFIEDAMRK